MTTMIGDYGLVFRAIVCIAICAWAALLAHMNISNFNDGARPVFPEFIEKRMTRTEFATVVTGMGVGWVASGISTALSTTFVATGLTLIATDIIGVWSPNKWVALVAGAAWGAACTFGLETLLMIFESLPYNFLIHMTSITTPVLPIFCFFPAVAVAGQFGGKKGMATGIVQAVVYVVCALIKKIVFGDFSISLQANAFAMLIGMVMLVRYAVTAKSGEEDYTDADEENVFTRNAQRIKGNLPYLMVQGALHALGIKILSQAYQPIILFNAASTGDYTAFYITMVANIIAFLPLIVSTALSTGVYQAVGLTTEFLVGALAPTWWLAPIFGAAVIFLEVQFVGMLGKLLSKFPELRLSGDHIRDGMAQTLSLALVIGSALAAYAMWSGTGLAILGVAYVLNDSTGQRVPKNAMGPFACVGIGLIVNILTVLGIAL
ncbi:MAG: hypothetical protein IJC38_06315 [Erysipelotrichaceae bacterium]|nr:hypothetical protein [Erysipelotrichaceae bacterium]